MFNLLRILLELFLSDEPAGSRRVAIGCGVFLLVGFSAVGVAIIFAKH
jgi:hypothetical protein